jgi:hypothetical protein
MNVPVLIQEILYTNETSIVYIQIQTDHAKMFL